ncbi:UDP-glycosyltransferase UGT5-like isoform X1 [Zophobas morio]|uniref:UDP-glycosyltransferase UGT5-like isoform X1 n=2 Tax=Zophobas morio TaxID=2755281 RepID=UPI003083B53C
MKIELFSRIILITVLEIGAESANILVVNSMPSYSHFIIPFKLTKELASRGHHVTSINAYPQRTKLPNYTDVPVVENIPLIEEMKQKMFARGSNGMFENLFSLFDMTAVITNSTLYNKNVQKLLNSDKKFDLVIIEHFFNDAFVGFGHHFNAPVIFVSTQAASAMNGYVFANPLPFSYVSGNGGTLTKHMNFWQRIQNLLMHSVFNTLIHFYHLPKQSNIFKSYVQDAEMVQVLYNTSLMLTNSHVSVSGAIPLVPSIIEIGGLHVTTKRLPDDLQTFLDNAVEGVIVFSMGSNLKCEDLKLETRESILKAFSKIKQKVLWKYESNLPDTPENVKISPWLPQQDVLAHPNVKVFVTHGGRLSTIEAIYFGVPLVGIPVFGDQLSNIATAAADGYAVKINLEELSEQTLSSALNEVLTNPRYKEAAQERSNLLHDQLLTPMESAIFWVEHVIRHRGAPHLKTAGVDLKWYQREMVDVIVFLLAVVTIMVFVICIVLKKLWYILNHSENVTTPKKKIQ